MGAAEGKISWITGSLRERDAALDLLRDTGQAEPRDEFGIAPLRDVLANTFFPGVTTIQTRAKYFLWVPAVYVELERQRPRGGRVREAVRKLEHDLMMGLRAAGESSGVIGSQQWKLPQRSATGLYWHGTRKWNMRTFSNPQAAYHRWLASSARAKPAALADEEGPHENWNAWFYEQESLLEDHTMLLSEEQGDFLARRIETIKDSPRRCLLKDLLDQELPEGVGFWDIGDVMGGATVLSDLAQHARYLSSAIDGAMRAYGALWARLREDLDPDEYGENFSVWARSHGPDYWQNWDLDQFWGEVAGLPRGDAARARTKTFVEGLIAEYGRLRGADVSDSLRVHLVVRERLMKPGRARLSGGATVKDRDPPGDGALGFRWRQARRMLEDIRNRGEP